MANNDNNTTISQIFPTFDSFLPITTIPNNDNNTIQVEISPKFLQGKEGENIDLTFELVGLDNDITDGDVQINYSTIDGTAKSNIDYVSSNGTITLTPREKSKSITIDLISDNENENTENFSLEYNYSYNLKNLQGDVIDTGNGNGLFTPIRIFNNEPIIELDIYNKRAIESDNVLLVFNLSNPLNEQFEVNYNTTDLTAQNGIDYVSKNGTLIFNPGETSKTLSIDLLDDNTEEDDENFNLNISYSYSSSSSSGGSSSVREISGSLSTPITIFDNDSIIDNTFDTPLIRFQNKNLSGTYLFAGLEESRGIYQNFPNFIDEGTAFKVASQEKDDLIRFNRFQNSSVPGTYLYAREEESVSIRQNFPNFIDEGIAFYAYDGNAGKGVDFYRFQNTAQPGTYIFVGEEEKNNIIANFPQFVQEGVAFEAIV